MGNSFKEMLREAETANDSVVGAGLDECMESFSLITDVSRSVCVYKIDPAAYRPEGIHGVSMIRRKIAHIRRHAPGIPIIFDAKYSGSKKANVWNAEEAFDFYNVDAVTVSPYNGMDTFEPFLRHKDKGIFVVCKTSNEGSGEFQDLPVPMPGKPARVPQYQFVAHRVATEWNAHGNCGLVIGATYPKALAFIRQNIIGDDMIILCPGGGKIQGGNIKEAMLAGKNSSGSGIIMHFSGQLELSPTPREEAEMLREQTNEYRREGR